MENLLDCLRHKTTKLHQALHVHPIMISCQEGTMSQSEYVHMLKAFYSPWKLLIPRIDHIPVPSLIPKLKKRAQSIEADLKNLSVDSNILDPIFPIPTTSKEALLGISYVLIGSTMGATMLAAKIKESLGEVPNAYLSMSPKEAGWPELIAVLRHLDSKDCSPAALAACSTFEKIGHELSANIES